MDSFSKKVKDGTSFREDEFSSELEKASNEVDIFPVKIGKTLHKFHSVKAGYEPEERYHYIKLVHLLQGDGSPPTSTYAKNIELYLKNMTVLLDVDQVRVFGDYPKDDFELVIKLSGYRITDRSFYKELMKSNQEIDHIDLKY